MKRGISARFGDEYISPMFEAYTTGNISLPIVQGGIHPCTVEIS